MKLTCTVEMGTEDEFHRKENVPHARVKTVAADWLKRFTGAVAADVEDQLEAVKVNVYINGESYQVPLVATIEVKLAPYVSKDILEHVAFHKEPKITFDSEEHKVLAACSRNRHVGVMEKEYRLLRATGYTNEYGRLTEKGVAALNKLLCCELPEHEADTAWELARTLTYPTHSVTYRGWLQHRDYLFGEMITEKGKEWLSTHMKFVLRSNWMREYSSSLYDKYFAYLPLGELPEFITSKDMLLRSAAKRKADKMKGGRLNVTK